MEFFVTREIPFECSDFKVDGLALSFLDSEGTKPPLHFYHANGFPVSMYLPWMTELTRDFRVMGLNLRGQDGLSEGISDWHRVAMDLAEFLEARGVDPVIGVGHSIGAVATMLCAARRPDLFSRIVLLDPPLFPQRWVTLFRWAKLFGQKKRFPPAVRARRRRNGWKDKQEALDYFRGKGMFEGWREEYLRAYVTYGLKPDPDHGTVLVCPPRPRLGDSRTTRQTYGPGRGSCAHPPCSYAGAVRKCSAPKPARASAVFAHRRRRPSWKGPPTSSPCRGPTRRSGSSRISARPGIRICPESVSFGRFSSR